MAVKYFLLAFFGFQLVTSFKISDKPTAEFNELIKSLQNFKPEVNRTKDLVERDVESIREDYTNSLINLLEVNLSKFKKYQEKAEEIGPEAVEFVQNQITTINSILNSDIDKTNLNCDEKHKELMNYLDGLNESIQNLIDLALLEWETCHGADCEEIITVLKSDVKEIGDVVNKLFGNTLTELNVLKGNNGAIFYSFYFNLTKILEGLEEYFNNLQQ